MTNLLWPQVHCVHVGRVMAENLQCKMCWWAVIDLSLFSRCILYGWFPGYSPGTGFLMLITLCICKWFHNVFVCACVYSYLSKCLHEKMHTSCLSTLYVTRFLLDLLSCTESGVPLHFSSCDCSQGSLVQHYSKKKTCEIVMPIVWLDRSAGNPTSTWQQCIKIAVLIHWQCSACTAYMYVFSGTLVKYK